MVPSGLSAFRPNRRILRARHLTIFPSIGQPSNIAITMASLGNSALLFRRFAPHLSKEIFTCRQCLVRTQNYSTRTSLRTPSVTLPRNTNRIDASSLRSNAKKAFARCVSDSAAANGAKSEVKKSSFPDVSSKSVAYWLLGSAASVFGIVVFGGLTRLTESGYVPFASDFRSMVSLANHDM